MVPARNTWPLTIALAVTVALPVAAQAQTGSIVGSVYDSTQHAPLVDAAVFLWNTPYQTVTDEHGLFRIDAVPAGEYSVLFFHTRLGDMGVSQGPLPVTVPVGDSTVVQLATPSMFTLVSSQCLLEEHTEGTGVIAGWVADAESGMGLSGAQVTLSWDVPARSNPDRMSLYAGTDGWYRTCAAPSDVPITMEAHYLDRQSLRREVSVTEGGFTQEALLLRPLDESHIVGRVRNATSDKPIAGVELWLRGTAIRTLTDNHGAFEMPDVPPGSYMLMSDHLAYGTKMDTLAVPSGRRLSVDMLLDTRPIEIAPLTVTAVAEPIAQRARGGIHISAADIDRVRVRSRDMADILRSQHIPGVIVRRRGDGSLCIGYSTGQVRMMGDTGCVPMMIFINDARASHGELVMSMPIESIDRMVIYKPVEAGSLFGLGAAEGVLVIYTKGN